MEQHKTQQGPHVEVLIGSVAWNKLYSIRLFDGLRFPESRVFEDITTTYRILMRCGAAVCVPFVGYHYVMRDGSIAHTHSLSNLTDHWDAHIVRRESLGECAGGLDRGCVRARLALDAAGAASAVWRWAYGCGRRDTPECRRLLDEVSGLVRSEFPLLGRRGWPLHARAGVMFAHFNNDVPLAAASFLNRAFLKLFRR